VPLVLLLLLQHHPHRTVSHFGGEPAWSGDDPILSRNGASGEPGAVQARRSPSAGRARLARASSGIHYSLCEPAVVTAAHAAVIAVGVFTVNDEETMERLTATA
jgi:hypothetical protein